MSQRLQRLVVIAVDAVFGGKCQTGFFCLLPVLVWDDTVTTRAGLDNGFLNRPDASLLVNRLLTEKPLLTRQIA
jgi:hypothetical protein